MHLTVCILYVEIWQFRTAVPYLQLRNPKGTTFVTYNMNISLMNCGGSERSLLPSEASSQSGFTFGKSILSQQSWEQLSKVFLRTPEILRGGGAVCVCACVWSHLGIVVGVVLLISLLLSFLNTQHKETSDYWASSAVSIMTLNPVSHFHQGLK